MLTIRRSHLEDFRHAVVTDWLEEEELIARLKGQSEPSRAAECGTLWHEQLSRQPAHEKFHFPPVSFNASDVAQGRKALGNGLWEVPASRLIRGVAGEDVLLSGTADHVWGLTITDNKLKLTPPDGRDYQQSLQWRVYLWLHECVQFTYFLWPFSEPTPNYLALAGPPTVFSFWRYEGMEADVLGWLEHFVCWARSRSLLRYLRTA